MFIAYYISYIKIILALLKDIVAFYIQVSIVKIRVFSFKKFISEYKVCLVIFLALNK